MIFDILVTELAGYLSKWFDSTASKTLTNDVEGEVAAGLREIAASIDQLAESTQNVANAIIDVKRSVDALEAEGYIELAAKSLKALVPDEAKKYLDKAQILDSTNWALWFGYVNWRVIQLLPSETGQPTLSNKDITALEKAVRFVGSANDINHAQKALAIFTLFGVSFLYAAPTAISLAMHTLGSQLQEIPAEKIQDYLPIVRACERIPICQRDFLGENLHERVRDWFEKEIDDALYHVDFSEKKGLPERAETAIKRINKALELGDGVIPDIVADRARTCRTLTEQCVREWNAKESIEAPGSCLLSVFIFGGIAAAGAVAYNFGLNPFWALAGFLLGIPGKFLQERVWKYNRGLPKEYDPAVEFDKLLKEWDDTCGQRKSE